MVELRWLVRPNKTMYPDGIERSTTVETILQYRQYIDHGGPYPKFDWTDWTDIPKVQEESP